MDGYVNLRLSDGPGAFGGAMDAGDPFRAGKLRGERDGVAWHSGTLDEWERDILRRDGADFVVYSYAEPIAVRVRGCGWYALTTGRSSGTTERHRRLIWLGIETFRMWADDAELPDMITTLRAARAAE